MLKTAWNRRSLSIKDSIYRTKSIIMLNYPSLKNYTFSMSSSDDYCHRQAARVAGPSWDIQTKTQVERARAKRGLLSSIRNSHLFRKRIPYTRLLQAQWKFFIWGCKCNEENWETDHWGERGGKELIKWYDQSMKVESDHSKSLRVSQSQCNQYFFFASDRSFPFHLKLCISVSISISQSPAARPTRYLWLWPFESILNVQQHQQKTTFSKHFV